jgi:hypothetical protein
MSWDITGNSDTDPDVNFLGTTDGQPLVVKTNGLNVLLQASGAGGFIGTTSNHPLVFRTNDLDRMAVDTNGNVRITGDIILTNADCAEDFDIADPTLVEPGTVMVLGEEGKLQKG